jgi:hypothetical protein
MTDDLRFRRRHRPTRHVRVESRPNWRSVLVKDARIRPERASHNNRCVGTSSARAWATIGFVIRLSSSKEVPDEHGVWLGSASAADHVRRDGHGVGRGVAGPGVAARPRSCSALVAPRRGPKGQRAAGGVGGGGVQRLALRGRGDRSGRVRGTRGRAGRYAGGAGPQASRQDRPVRRPA